jgi:hypothetical protein
MTLNHYSAYGLTIASEINSPQLTPLIPPPDNPSADVFIRFGEAPQSLENPVAQGAFFQASPTQFLLHVKTIGSFLVLEGREIIIQPAPQATQEEVNLFLFGSVFGAVLHQRGYLALHASAIVTPRGSVLFMGNSGHGKSTTAAAFLRRGYQILADDVCALRLDQSGRPVVIPAFPQLKIWADAAEKLNTDIQSLRKVRTQLEKYVLPVQEHFNQAPTPIHALYHLNIHNQPEIRLEKVEDAEQFKMLLDNTYRAHFLDGFKMRGEHFRLAMVVTKSSQFRRVTRPLTPFLLDELVDLIEADFSGDSGLGD